MFDTQQASDMYPFLQTLFSFLLLVLVAYDHLQNM
ncbi:MAG: hypothetical protein RLY27_1756, partial [Pseudomonadota bacterium]